MARSTSAASESPDFQRRPVGARVGGGQRAGNRGRHRPFGDRPQAGRVLAHFVEGEVADVGPDLLVEELLQRQRLPALLGVGGVERRFGEAPLEGLDDRARAADVPSLERENGEGRLLAAGQPEGDGDVGAGKR